MTDNRNLLTLTAEEEEELERWAQSRTLPAGDVFRARLILVLGAGKSYRDIENSMHSSAATIARWKTRFERDRLAGLEGRHKGSRPRMATAAVQARVVRRVQQKPNDGSTHWSCRKLAGELGVSKSTVQRILTQARLKPHRLERYLASNDPDFESKAADIIGLYMNPPQHAAVFCVDEKTAIQALDRLDPVLPLSPGRAERHGFEYYRHGTLGKRDSHRARQPLGAQDQSGGGVSAGESESPVPLHADLFFLAQSGGAVVCQDSARCHCSWRFYFGGRFSSQTAEIHSRLRQLRQTISLDLHRPEASHPYLRNHRDSSLALES